jgi:hypothetical protein
MRALIVAAMLGTLVLAQPADERSSGYRTILQFDVMSTREIFTRTIAPGLQFRATHARAIGAAHYGWDLSVARDNDGTTNLLYESLLMHGPQPFHLYAWHFAGGDYWGTDDPRILPVYGYPWELRVDCVGCHVTGKDFQSQIAAGQIVFQNEFTAGLVKIGLRHLTSANPRQIR